MNKNCAEFFPILMYKDGKIIRINGSKNIISGSYTLLPLFSVDQFPDYTIEMAAAVNHSTVGVRCTVMELDVTRLDLPDPCFLVAHRHGYPYTIEEVESLNKIWERLMIELI